jgi:hypothetical protein
MKTITSVICALALLLTGFWCPTASAQEGEPMLPGARYTNCYPSGSGSSSSSGSRAASSAQRPSGTDYCYFGKDVTPRGTLKVLVIFAGFTNDGVYK